MSTLESMMIITMPFWIWLAIYFGWLAFMLYNFHQEKKEHGSANQLLLPFSVVLFLIAAGGVILSWLRNDATIFDQILVYSAFLITTFRIVKIKFFDTNR